MRIDLGGGIRPMVIRPRRQGRSRMSVQRVVTLFPAWHDSIVGISAQVLYEPRSAVSKSKLPTRCDCFRPSTGASDRQTSMSTSEDYARVGRILIDGQAPLKARFRALFTLKSLGGAEAVAWLARAFDDPSALLKHEVAFCLGQMGHPDAVPILRAILSQPSREPIVRHEAGEALAALGGPDILVLLRQFQTDPVPEVADTCRLGVQRLEYYQSEASRAERLSANPYGSVDPAPPLAEVDVDRLRTLLLDETEELFVRYRAMFSLRNIGTDPCILALAQGLKCRNALFRHEIAYVLGQIQSDLAKQALFDNLRDEAENDMVRHECAEALGSIASVDINEELKKYLDPTNPPVLRESCVVALDFCDYNQGSDFQYADGLTTPQKA